MATMYADKLLETNSNHFELVVPDELLTYCPLPYYNSCVSAGFPSPADDYLEKRIDLNHQLINHPSATFFVRVKGDSMMDANILDGDILIVDKAVEPKNNHIVVCILNGDFTVKRIMFSQRNILLVPENPQFKVTEITPDSDFQVWGVVTYIIHKAR